MRKFRKWFFEFLTGYDLVEYEEILNLADKVNKNGVEVIALARQVHDDNKRILKNNGEIIETNRQVLDISNRTIEDLQMYSAFMQGGARK